MATIFLSSVDGSDSDNGSTWTLAKATLTGALAAVSADGDIIKVDSAHSETIAADVAYTIPKRIKIVSVNRSGSDALLAGASIKTDGNKVIDIAGTGYAFYIYGMTLGLSNTTQGPAIYVNGRSGCQATYDTCTFDLNADNNGAAVYCGSENFSNQTSTTLRNCTFKLYRTGQSCVCQGERTSFINCSLDAAGSAPTAFLHIYGNGVITCEGCDWSHVGTGTLVAPIGYADEGTAIFRNCKFGSGMTLLGAAIYLGYNEANHAAFAYNCASGDTHYALWHVNGLGETTVSTTVYVTADGAAYDGTNRCSWKIVTTAYAGYDYPYISPWIDVYHDGTDAITPYLEILRSGSTTKYQNDEVWSEWSYQGTSGSTKATFVNDRMTPLGTAADQTASSLGASDWTGEHASDNAYMKLESGSITPAEIGHLRARVCVGEPSITVYVDPQVRGLS